MSGDHTRLVVAEEMEVVRVSLEIEAGSDPIAGVIRTEDVAVPFVGWLSLSAGLERLRRVEEQPDVAVGCGFIASARLTATEREIVSLLCDGLTNPQIAQRLTVSARTVQGHLLKVFRKLGVSSRTELVARLLRAEIRDASENEVH